MGPRCFLRVRHEADAASFHFEKTWKKYFFLIFAYLGLLLILKDGTWCFGWWRWRAVIGKNRILHNNSCKIRRAHITLLLYQLPIYYIQYIYLHRICACAQLLHQLKTKQKRADNVNLTSIRNFPPPKKKTKLKVSRHDPWPSVHR